MDVSVAFNSFSRRSQRFPAFQHLIQLITTSLIILRSSRKHVTFGFPAVQTCSSWLLHRVMLEMWRSWKWAEETELQEELAASGAQQYHQYVPQDVHMNLRYMNLHSYKSVSLSLCLSHWHSLSHSVFLSVLLSVSHCIPVCLTLSHTVSVSLSVSFCLFHTHSVILSLSVSHSVWYCPTLSCFTLCLSLVISFFLSHSHSVSICHSLPVSLCLILCYFPSHSVTLFLSQSASLCLSHSICLTVPFYCMYYSPGLTLSYCFCLSPYVLFVSLFMSHPVTLTLSI